VCRAVTSSTRGHELVHLTLDLSTPGAGAFETSHFLCGRIDRTFDIKPEEPVLHNFERSIHLFLGCLVPLAQLRLPLARSFV